MDIGVCVCVWGGGGGGGGGRGGGGCVGYLLAWFEYYLYKTIKSFFKQLPLYSNFSQPEFSKDLFLARRYFIIYINDIAVSLTGSSLIW